MFRLFVLCCFALPTQMSWAQEGYPNSCNPKKHFECIEVALLYKYESMAPIPKDPGRAKALTQLAFNNALNSCKAKDYGFCQSLALAVEARLFKVGSDEEKKIGAIPFTVLFDGCSNGDAEACWELRATDMWPLSNINTADFHDQTDGALNACLSGQERACYGWTRFYFIYLIREFPDDTRKAIFEAQKAVLETACDDKNAEACQSLILVSMEQGTRQHYISLACENGIVATCTIIGHIKYKSFLETKDEADLSRAISLWDSGCQQDDAVACHLLEHAIKM